RIRGLSVGALLKDMLLPKPRDKQRVVKTLIDSFHYPRLGPGMMWEACAREIESLGGSIAYNTEVNKIQWTTGRIVQVSTAAGATYEASPSTSRMAIGVLIGLLVPLPPVKYCKPPKGSAIAISLS